MSKLQQSLKKGLFTITGEVGPPKGVNLEHCMEKEVEYIKDRVVAINVTDNQSSVMRISSQSVCSLLVQKGLEPILQITCRDRNRLAIQSDILGAYVQGIRNILALTGDHNTAGDHPDSKPVFDLDSVSLLMTITSLKNGKDLAGQELDGVPEDIFAGATVTPGADPLEMQLIKMERKIESGAQFFQTQAVYDPAVFENFMNKAQKYKVPVLCGIVIIKSPGMAKYMNNFVPGVFVPDNMIKPLAEASKEDRPKKSIELMAEFIRKIKPMCQGIHIMAMGWEKYVPEMLDMCDL
ncbi:MAG: 5,10-methylenetetrahydrofolate reductase [Spirochaetes bacterium]|nr:MAG: 5,10-methylenetetrahydrofolate reductase [Spirochaetota bacterium]RKY02804.1 MAG: 5,10-methylenetetrahydrofolate reductase [Spirochaetota bacterium]